MVFVDQPLALSGSAGKCQPQLEIVSSSKTCVSSEQLFLLFCDYKRYKDMEGAHLPKLCGQLHLDFMCVRFLLKIVHI